jgi:hypothetical protein
MQGVGVQQERDSTICGVEGKVKLVVGNKLCLSQETLPLHGLDYRKRISPCFEI